MSLQIGCPKCGKLLNASPSLVGKIVACPRCENRFRIGPIDESTESGDAAPANPDYYPPTDRTNGPTGAAVVEKAPLEKTPPEKTADQLRSPKPAGHHTARFIKRDPNATQVQLGEDGQLPDLELSEQKKRDDAAGGPKSTSPLLLIGVLCISVLMSVLILVIDEPAPGTDQSQMDARQTLEHAYTTWEPDELADREILDLLALAIQAYNRGDIPEERRYYRQILNLLNREDAPRYGGYSGDDESLKNALSTLLR